MIALSTITSLIIIFGFIIVAAAALIGFGLIMFKFEKGPTSVEIVRCCLNKRAENRAEQEFIADLEKQSDKQFLGS